MCGKCSRSSKRSGCAGTMKPRSQEYKTKMRLSLKKYHEAKAKENKFF